MIIVLVSKLNFLSRSSIADVFVVYFRTKNVKHFFLCCFIVTRSPPLYAVPLVFVSPNCWASIYCKDIIRMSQLIFFFLLQLRFLSEHVKKFKDPMIMI